MKLEFSRQILENARISKSIKIRPVRAELLRADGQTIRHGEYNSRVLQICERA